MSLREALSWTCLDMPRCGIGERCREPYSPSLQRSPRLPSLCNSCSGIGVVGEHLQYQAEKEGTAPHCGAFFSYSFLAYPYARCHYPRFLSGTEA